MYTYLKKGSHSSRRKNDFVVNREKTATFGKKSLRTLEHKIWSSLPKDLSSLLKCTESIKTRYGPECRFNICKYLGKPYHYI